MIRKMFLLFIILFVLSACGNQPDPEYVNGNSGTENETQVPSDLDPGQQSEEVTDEEQNPDASTENNEPVENGTGSGEDKGEQNSENTETDQTEDEASVAEKLYKLNDYYIVVPTKEGIDKKVVLLTFDDGPKERDMIESMLDVLEKHDAKAIFFVNGHRVKQNPDLLKMIHESGNAIGNHGWSHENLGNADEEKINQEVVDTQEIVKETIGEVPLFFRPPHGAGNSYLKQKVKEEGMLYMTWSTSPEDWLTANQTADMVVKNTLERVHSGANLLMHELPWTVEALDTLLTELTAAGYGFVDPKLIEIPQD